MVVVAWGRAADVRGVSAGWLEPLQRAIAEASWGEMRHALCVVLSRCKDVAGARSAGAGAVLLTDEARATLMFQAGEAYLL